MDEDLILCVSGGIDSYIAWHYLGTPKTVFFDCGSKYSAKEKKVVKELMPDTIIDKSLSLGDREVGDNAYIPYRNLLFAAQATHYANQVVIAGIADDEVEDKNAKAFAKMTALLCLIGKETVEIFSPFWYFTKEEIISWYLGSGLPKSKLMKTTSCYHETKKNCGKCPSCFRKYIAFRMNGIDYDFRNDELANEYLQKAKSGSHYNEQRNLAIIQVLEEDNAKQPKQLKRTFGSKV